MHMPPPVHGAAVMGAQVRDSRLIRERFDGRYINLSASSSLEEIGKGRFRKLLFVIRLLRQVRRELREWKPDLVYLTPTSTLPALLKDYSVVRLVRRFGCRIVLHFHNKGVAARSNRWLDDRVYRRLFQGTDVILLSDALRKDVEKYVPAERIAICPNGLDLPEGKERTPGTGDVQLLFLSNLLPDKGFEDLLDACVLLRRQGVPFRCRFVGAPSASISKDEFLRRVEKRNLSDSVVYEGPKYGPEKQAVLRGADMLVHPTRDDCFPLVILEAMAVGLPVVSSREGGIPDEVEDGVSGLLCEKGNPVALADAISSLAGDEKLRLKMGNAGRERYLTHFTAACFERRMVEILQSYV
jgi:glycosyltransferase involved in cell wall biosynthesis